MKNFRGIFAICFMVGFLLTGIIGHDPWKQDETYSFGIIYHFYTAHRWLVPMNVDVAFMEKPPLYYWTAVMLCRIFGHVLALHDAARLASFFYMLIAAGFFWKATGIFLERHERPQEARLTALLLFLGTAGIVRHSHDMFTDVALLAGSIIILYGAGLLLSRPEHWKRAGVWLGTGAGIAFLSKGIFLPGVYAVSILIMLGVVPRLRNLRTLNTLLLAGIVASPFFLIWPILLYRHSHLLFMQWFWENNIGRFLGFSVPELGASNEPGYILYSAFWFAFPVFPLAVLRIIRALREWRRDGTGVTLSPERLLPAVISITGLWLLLLSASARALYLLPLIPAFAVVGAPEVFHLHRGFVAAWNHCVRIVFLGVIVLLWLVWGGLLTGHNLPEVAQVLPVDFVPQDGWWLPVLAALAATGCFLSMFRLTAHSARHVASIWFSGVAATWIVGMALLLPWIDETKSYRPVLKQMEGFIDHSPYKDDKMNVYRLGESIAPMLEYFGESHVLHTVRRFDNAFYPLVLTVESKTEPVNHGPQWTLVWEGARVLDTKDEELCLYARKR